MKSRLSTFERSVAFILALCHTGLGLYYAGPWYITESPTTVTGSAPTLDLLPNESFVHGYGLLLMISSIVMGVLALNKNVNLNIFGWVVLSNFILRLYHLAGTMAAQESLLPPSWGSRLAIVLILGALWLWVRHLERLTE